MTSAFAVVRLSDRTNVLKLIKKAYIWKTSRGLLGPQLAHLQKELYEVSLWESRVNFQEENKTHSCCWSKGCCSMLVFVHIFKWVEKYT